MAQYEYRVVAAPTRGVKAKGIKTAEDRFSHALEEIINQYAIQGWEYLRAETLPSVERSGLRSSTTNWRNMLVFRRATQEEEAVVSVVTAEKAPVAPAASVRKEPAIVAPQTPDDDASQSEGATRMLTDNGVEEPSDVSGMTNSLKQLASSRNSDKSKD